MKGSRLLEILEGITLAEFKKFGDFVKSPYHNKNKNLISLYELLNKFSPYFDNHELTREGISKFIYPRENYRELKVELLVSDFKNLLQDFLIFEESSKNKVSQKNLLLKAFRERNIVKNFDYTLNEIMRCQKDEFNRTSDYYHNQSLLEYESCISKLNSLMYSKNKSFQKLADNIDLFYISFKLFVFVLVYHHIKEARLDINYNLWLENEIISYIENNIDLIKKEHPLIYSYYLILMILIKPGNEKYFEDLKKYIKINRQKLSPDILKEIYLEMKNYCDTKISINRSKYTNEMFNIYKTLDEKEIFQKDKFIEHVDFLNAITIGLDLNKTQWVDYFSNKYKNKIESRLKYNTQNLAKAQIYFHKKEYAKALKDLNQVAPKIFYFYLRIKVMYTKIYYEMNEIEAVLYVIDSLKHYLKRNKSKISGHYEVVSKFLYYIGKIINIKNSKPNKDITLLKKEIKKDHDVAAKFWLIEKLEELEKE